MDLAAGKIEAASDLRVDRHVTSYNQASHIDLRQTDFFAMNDRCNQNQDASTSLTLISLLKAKNDDAWHELVREYGLLVEEWTIRSRVPPHDVPDVVQDVLQSVARSIQRFHRDRSSDSFRKWLRVITANKVRDYYRRSKATPLARGGTTAMQLIHLEPDGNLDEPLADDASSETFSVDAIPQEVSEKIRRQVKPQTWQAFWLTVVEDRSPADVAEELQISVWSVYQARSRTLARFRQELSRLALPGDDNNDDS